jgi:hypothetical protein
MTTLPRMNREPSFRGEGCAVMSKRTQSPLGEPMTLGQHARQRRAVARRVVLAVPRCHPERGPLAQSHAGAIVRAAHGVHEMRNHRCRRPAELEGTATAREPDRGAMAMTTRSLNGEQRRALDIWPAVRTGARKGHCGRTGSRWIVHTGLAVASPEIVKAGGRTLSMLRLMMAFKRARRLNCHRNFKPLVFTQFQPVVDTIRPNGERLRCARGSIASSRA